MKDGDYEEHVMQPRTESAGGRVPVRYDHQLTRMQKWTETGCFDFKVYFARTVNE